MRLAGGTSTPPPAVGPRVETPEPPWQIPELRGSRRRLEQFLRYSAKVFDLPRQLARLHDPRREPKVAMLEVLASLVHAALLRIPSLNALEGDLTEADFQRLIGRRPAPGKAFSAETVSRVLDSLDLGELRALLTDGICRAERNKAFRDGLGGLRCVAVDGWEPFSSYHRHCEHCLTRQVKRQGAPGEDPQRVTQYYHRFVVAMLVGPVVDVVLGIEPVRNATARREAGESDAEGEEGELPAALRLIETLHQTYGRFLDVFVLDGLYPNGPVFTKLAELGYGAFIVLRNEGQEPLREALALWDGHPPCREYEDPERRERVELWHAPEIETLETYAGSIDVLRARVHHPRRATRTWCVAIVGRQARRVGLRTALEITRSRWHIENTAFHQWVTYWHLGHVFHHRPNALTALLLVWSVVFNLLEWFVYRRLRRPRRPRDRTDTLRHLVAVMRREVATLAAPFPWGRWADTS